MHEFVQRHLRYTIPKGKIDLTLAEYVLEKNKVST